MKTTLIRLIAMKTILVLLPFFLFFSVSSVQAQELKDVRWKSTSQVRNILGEPLSISSPTGTHATYTMWKYPNVTVAFSNGKAFHMFKNDSLNRIRLQENR